MRARVLRNIKIAREVLNGETYLAVGQRYELSPSAIEKITGDMVMRLGTLVPRVMLESAFPRDKYPEAYSDSPAPDGEAHSFYLNHLSIHQLRDRSTFLIEWLMNSIDAEHRREIDSRDVHFQISFAPQDMMAKAERAMRDAFDQTCQAQIKAFFGETVAETGGEKVVGAGLQTIRDFLEDKFNSLQMQAYMDKFFEENFESMLREAMRKAADHKARGVAFKKASCWRPN
ncbi:hypothetical protein [Ralstonia phage RP31]|uniref:Uncharacterized protein n=2 Tax=Ripduovirus RP12 TaxID=2560700 RepID=A0A1L7N124_9CAUD|nr:hypothetical protein FDH28_gp217 [Ralstonia phage RP12]BAW19178.1 hypothetical protein [Ralstonia phage RP12]BAW19464.1 hypothetical protein [Ralstonia phage RP31]